MNLVSIAPSEYGHCMEMTQHRDQWNCFYGVVHNANGIGACAVSSTRGSADLLEKMKRVAKEEWNGIPIDERTFGAKPRG